MSGTSKIINHREELKYVVKDENDLDSYFIILSF